MECLALNVVGQAEGHATQSLWTQARYGRVQHHVMVDHTVYDHGRVWHNPCTAGSTACRVCVLLHGCLAVCLLARAAAVMHHPTALCTSVA